MTTSDENASDQKVKEQSGAVGLLGIDAMESLLKLRMLVILA